MRAIEVDDLKEGMIVSRTILADNGNLLLRKGIKLRNPLIKTIKRAGILVIYIDDEFSKDIVPEEIINEQFRKHTTRKLKTFFTTPYNKLTGKAIETFQKELSQDLMNMIEQILGNKDSLANLVCLKNHNDYTFQHSVNVVVISTVMGFGLGFNKNKLLELAKCAIFHDIGKMLTPNEILDKPDRLTEEEFDIVKKHPMNGYDIGKNILNLSSAVLAGILQHHEKYDGNGYPLGRKRGEIYIFAQIVAIADAYDAMTSKRPYREALLPIEAMHELMDSAGVHFSEELVDLFLSKVAIYPVGCLVELNNGMRGIVYANVSGHTLRPMIKVFTDDPGQLYVNLSDPEYAYLSIVNMML